MSGRSIALLIAAAILPPALLQGVGMPISFQNGEIANSDDVNSNFAALTTAVQALENRLDAIDAIQVPTGENVYSSRVDNMAGIILGAADPLLASCSLNTSRTTCTTKPIFDAIPAIVVNTNQSGTGYTCELQGTPSISASAVTFTVYCNFNATNPDRNLHWNVIVARNGADTNGYQTIGSLQP